MLKNSNFSVQLCRVQKPAVLDAIIIGTSPSNSAAFSYDGQVIFSAVLQAMEKERMTRNNTDFYNIPITFPVNKSSCMCLFFRQVCNFLS